jgi:hypothetical protein
MRLVVTAMNKGAIGVTEETQRRMAPRPSSSLSLGLVSLRALDVRSHLAGHAFNSPSRSSEVAAAFIFAMAR